MAVDNSGATFQELLNQLAKAKPLPVSPSPFRTKKAIAGSQLGDTQLGAVSAAPSLQDQIARIAKGNTAPTGWKGALYRGLNSPPGKVVLGGLQIVDTPRRAIISTLKETVDAFDTDPNTTTSLGDFVSQVKDPTFGFGRIYAKPGAGGRIVGFIGDVLLDPITYATFGASVPLKGATSAATAAKLLEAGAGKTLFRQSANLSGREGRAALAKVLQDMGAEAGVVKNVLARGKSAVPRELAEELGLPRNGLYMFGSRVRVPGSGVIGSALERGVVGSRLFLTNTKWGTKLQYMYTPRGVSGVYGDVSQIRADLASGRLDAETANAMLAGLNGIELGRRAGARARGDYGRGAARAMEDQQAQKFDTEIHRFIESADDAALTAEQRKARNLAQGVLEAARVNIEGAGKVVDDTFELKNPALQVDEATGVVTNRYVPHVYSDDFYKWAERNPQDPFFQLIEREDAVNVLDMRNSLAHRGMKKGTNFLETDKVIKYGTIEELNALWRETTGLDFDLFETSMSKILSKYARTVDSAHSVFAFLGELKNTNFLRMMEQQGVIDPDYLRAMAVHQDMMLKNVARLAEKKKNAAGALRDAVVEMFDNNVRRGPMATMRRVVSDTGEEIRLATAAVKSVDQSVAQIEALSKTLDEIAVETQAKMVELTSATVEKNVVMGHIGDIMRRASDEATSLARQARQLAQDAASGRQSAEALEERLVDLQTNLSRADAAFSRANETVEYMRVYGDELGPAMQRIYQTIRQQSNDGDLPAMLAAGETFAKTGDEETDRIIDILMRPFNHLPYKNTVDLDNEWLSLTMDSNESYGRVLRSIPGDVGGDVEGGRVTRKGMAYERSATRKLTQDNVNEIVGRAATVGDNPEKVGDAFFFMTARMLRYAFDAAGGGDAGLAAQKALADELLTFGPGVSARARAWQEANGAVSRIVEQRKVLEELGSRRVMRGGEYEKYEQAVIDIAALEEKLKDAGTFVDEYPTVGAAYDSFRVAFNQAKSGGLEDARTFAYKAIDLVAVAAEAEPSLRRSPSWITLMTLANDFEKAVAAGNTIQNTGALDALYARFVKEVTDAFTDPVQVQRDVELLNSTRRRAAEAMSLDKSFNDAKMNLDISVKDAGVKVANYQLLHAADMAVDALTRLLPNNTPTDTLWRLALSGAARQQLAHVERFEKVISQGRTILSTIRDEVYGVPSHERAGRLAYLVEQLSPDDKEALYSVTGDLTFITDTVGQSRGIQYYRRHNGEYERVLNDIVTRHQGPNWKRQTEIEGFGGYVKVESRAKYYDADYDRTSESYSGKAELDDVLSPNQEEALARNRLLKESENRINKLQSSTPDALRRMIDDLVERGSIDAETKSRLLDELANAEQLANAAMARSRPKSVADLTKELDAAKKSKDLDKAAKDELVKKLESELRFARQRVDLPERVAKRVAEGARKDVTDTYGLARQFWMATRVDKGGASRAPRQIDDFFTLAFGDGEIRVGWTGGSRKPVYRYGGDMSDEVQTWNPSTGAMETVMLQDVSEESYARLVDATIAAARAEKARRIATIRAKRGTPEYLEQKLVYDLEYYDLEIRDRAGSLNTVGEVVDADKARRLVNERHELLLEQPLLKENVSVSRTDAERGMAQDLLRRNGAKVEAIDKELNDMERRARQLVQRGEGSGEVITRRVEVEDSIFGSAAKRNNIRMRELRILAQDPSAAPEYGSLDFGLESSVTLGGDFGLVEHLRSKIRQLEAAVKVVEQAKKKGTQEAIDKAKARAPKRVQQAVEAAEMIANNPVLRRRLDAILLLDSADPAKAEKAYRDLLMPKKVGWLGDSRLGKEVDESGDLLRGVPTIVKNKINAVRRAARSLREIERSPEYTAALERQFKNEFLKILAAVDINNQELEFAQHVFDSAARGRINRFSSRDVNGVGDFSADAEVYVMNELAFDNKMVDRLLANKAGEYYFTVNGLRVRDHVARDVAVAELGGKFRYKVETSESSSGVKQYKVVNLDSGAVYHYDELPAELITDTVLETRAPFYTLPGTNLSPTGMRGPLAGDLANEFREFAGRRGERVVYKPNRALHAAGEVPYHGDETFAVYSTGSGTQRVFKMSEIDGVVSKNSADATVVTYPRGEDPLDPRNVFAGIRDDFDSIYEPTAKVPDKKSGLSYDAVEGDFARATEGFVRARSQKRLSQLRTAREKLVAEFEVQTRKRSEAATQELNARTFDAQRAARTRRAVAADRLNDLRKEIDALDKQIRSTNPVVRMNTLMNAFDLIRKGDPENGVLPGLFRDPTILRRLGVKVEMDPRSVTDEQALEGFKRYVEGLKRGRLRAGKNEEVINEVAASELKRRRDVLKQAWSESESGLLLARKDMAEKVIAANRKALQEIMDGGPGETLLRTLRGHREELARAERELGLANKDLARTIKQVRGKIEPGEDVSAAAERIAQQMAEQASANQVSFGMTRDAIEAAKVEAQALLRERWYQDSYLEQAKTTLLGVRSTVAARESILASLKQQQKVVEQQLDAIGKSMSANTLTVTEHKRLGAEFRTLKLKLDGRGKVKGLKQRIADAQEEIAKLHERRLKVEGEIAQHRSAYDVGFYAQLTKDDAVRRMELVKRTMDDLKELRKQAKGVKTKDAGWEADVDELAEEVRKIIDQLNELPKGPDTDRLAAVLTGYAEAKANLLRAQTASEEFAINSVFGAQAHLIFRNVLSDGWVELSGVKGAGSGALEAFANLELKENMLEIFNNMGRLRDPVFVKEMQRFTGRYTRFFRAWALATPGYHVRNTLTNAFMMVAAGGKPRFLSEGAKEWDALYKAVYEGGQTIDDYVASIPDAVRRKAVNDAYDAMLGSGVGNAEEIAFDIGGRFTNNAWTKLNRRAAIRIEQHSRFMLAYDGVRQGYGVNGAQARVRKFLFDYEDISRLDVYARSVIPFWMWTSRNFPLTIQNIYMNPKPYQFYGNLKRALEDEDKTDRLPLWMRETGGFGLAGTGLALTPDLGFNRQAADVAMLADPARLAANVNPILRVPVEVALANKSFFRNRQFGEAPVQVQGPVGNLAALLGAPLGLSPSKGGQQFANEKLLYALSNVVPPFNQAERFIPSQDYYSDRGKVFPFLQYLGVPVKPVTPQMQTSELIRRRQELQKLLRSQPKVEQ